MPAFSTEVPHALGQTEATSRLKGFVEQVRDRYGDQVGQMSGSWTGNVLDFSLTTFGMTITGKLIVEEAAARVAGQLPLAAAFIRGQIEQRIASELQQALS
jgi:hypothetical protein